MLGGRLKITVWRAGEGAGSEIKMWASSVCR